MQISRRGAWFLVPLALLWGAAAEAQQRASLLSGKYGKRIGAIVNVPQRGNAVPSGLGTTNCLTQFAPPFGPNKAGNHIIGLNAGLIGTITAPTPFFQVPANPRGCVPGFSGSTGSGGPLVTGSNPASFTVPPSAFGQPRPATRNVIPVPIVPVIVQFGSSASVMGPRASPLTPRYLGATMTTTVGTAAWRNFRGSAWTTQTGRPGPNFTACWGGGGGPPGELGSCTNINQGTVPLLVKYRGGSNRFGGTMALLLDSRAPGGITVAFINTPLIGPGQIRIQNISAYGSGAVGGGRGYRGTTSPMTPPISRIYNTWVPTYVMTPTGAGGTVTLPLIKSLGPFVSTFPVGAPQTFAGFPFTTGSVLARNTGTQGGNPLTVSLTARGTDARTALGSGNITLVAGGLAPSQAANTGHIDIVSMNFFLPEPDATLLLLAGLLTLVGLARLRRAVL